MRISDLPSLIFDKKFEIPLYWYSMKGCGLPYPPWFLKKKKIELPAIVGIAWNDADFPTLSDFLMNNFEYRYIDIAWKDADFLPTMIFKESRLPLYILIWCERMRISLPYLIFWKEQLSFLLLLVPGTVWEDADFPTLHDFVTKSLKYRYIVIAWKKDGDFLPSLIFYERFELPLYLYSMKGRGFPSFLDFLMKIWINTILI